MADENNPQKVIERWLSIFSVIFALWAGVVGWGVSLVNKIFAQHQELEHRVTKLEDGQTVQDLKRDRIEADVDKLKDRK